MTKINQYRSGFLMAGLLAAAFAPGAQALTASGSLGVSAVVANNCTIVATPLAFQTLTSGADKDDAVAGTVRMICTSNQTSVSLTLDGGVSVSGAQRRMKNTLSANYIDYDLFSDSARTSAVAVGGVLYSGALTAAIPTTVSVYGTAAGGEYTIGQYGDSVGLTLTYD